MGLLEKMKYNFCDQKEKIINSHLKNLFSIAYADGKMENIEFEYILSVADRLYINRHDVRELHSTLEDIPFCIPKNENQRIDHIYDMISLCIVDGKLDNNEILCCKKIFIEFGYKPVVFELVLAKILDSVNDKLLKEIALNTIKKLLKNN